MVFPLGRGDFLGPRGNNKNKKTTPSHEARSEDAERKNPLFWASESRAAEPGTTSVAGVHAEHKAQENAEPGARPGLPAPQAAGRDAGRRRGAPVSESGRAQRAPGRARPFLLRSEHGGGPAPRAGAGRARPPARPPALLALTGPAAVRLPAAGRGERSGSGRSPNRSMTEAGRRLRHTRSPRPAAGSTPCGGCGAAEAAAAAAREPSITRGRARNATNRRTAWPCRPRDLRAGGAARGRGDGAQAHWVQLPPPEGAGNPPGLLT